ncbi:MAG TPA: tRNA glutamyl-Q(34) synthetase GluQRS [Candidatus Sumerlaeota bacterium]|nr:MAG: Glutamate--tRNA ligase [candidate division BRC1 bacterium ADurb.BinA292]HOE97419.1 tRNA glutamyl-Q(34) synthetase GluQRS [Candidatus Sumerlaeota bacterium]
MSADLRPVKRTGPVGRYAPSPTGDLHLGNLRTALRAWEDCRRRGGTFILRIEDLDPPRTVPGAEARMIEDLRWLGLDWDEGPDAGGPAGPYRQSERGAIYQAALDELTRRGLTYPCVCSRRDLREASAPHGEAGEPVYPGVCRSADPERLARHPGGAAVRFRLPDDAVIEFEDAAAGPQRFDLNRLCGDFVIRRRDGLWAYQLACAIDDALMGVTHVVRGADLLTSTPRQIAVLRALGLPVPSYCHIPLVADEAGRRMCKRDGSCSIRALRAAGQSADEVRRIIMQARLVDVENG